MPKISQYSDGGNPTDQDEVIIVRGGVNYKLKDFVHNQVLNGLSTATNAVITTVDTVLTAFGKLQAQITAKGVTNGDTHDHSGGDGAQINHTTLSNIGTNTHAQIDTKLATVYTGGLIRGAGATLEISVGGSITPTHTFHRVDTNGGAATDNLPTINAANAVDGDVIVITSTNNARDVTVQDAVDNINCAGDFTLANARDKMMLVWDSALSLWCEVSRSTN